MGGAAKCQSVPYLLYTWQSLNSSSLSAWQCSSRDLSLGGGGEVWETTGKRKRRAPRIKNKHGSDIDPPLLLPLCFYLLPSSFFQAWIWSL